MKRDQRGGRVAAFFDLDGTLIGGPSLERRFVGELRYRRAIPLRNYFLWLGRAALLAPRGMQMMRHANKVDLRGGHAGEGGSGCNLGRDAHPASEGDKIAVPAFVREGAGGADRAGAAGGRRR